MVNLHFHLRHALDIVPTSASVLADVHPHAASPGFSSEKILTILSPEVVVCICTQLPQSSVGILK